MITDIVSLDYLTMTTFDRNSLDLWMALSAQYHGELDAESNHRRMQYTGSYWRSDAGSTFIGSAVQGEFVNYMLTGTSEMAPIVFDWKTEQARASRIDIQITLPLPDGWKARDFHDALKNTKIAPDKKNPDDVQYWPNRRKPKLTLYEDDGLDTVYIGARSGDRFHRWYVKRDKSGGLWLRFEVQFRGKRSHQVWKYIQDGQTLNKLLAAEYVRLPLHIRQTNQMKAFTLFFENFVPIPTIGGHTTGATWQWFQNQVRPAMVRLLRDPRIGDEVHDYVQRILDGRAVA